MTKVYTLETKWGYDDGSTLQTAVADNYSSLLEDIAKIAIKRSGQEYDIVFSEWENGVQTEHHYSCEENTYHFEGGKAADDIRNFFANLSKMMRKDQERQEYLQELERLEERKKIIAAELKKLD